MASAVFTIARYIAVIFSDVSNGFVSERSFKQKKDLWVIVLKGPVKKKLPLQATFMIDDDDNVF